MESSTSCSSDNKDEQNLNAASNDTGIIGKEETKDKLLTLPIIHTLLRPFGQCHEFFTKQTIDEYFQPL